MKFISLLKKELRELLNAQMLIGLVVTGALLFAMGSLIGNVADKASESGGELYLCDQDQTEYTASIIKELEDGGFTIHAVEAKNEDRAALMQELDINGLLILPKGFTDTVLKEHKPAQLETITVVESASVMSNLTNAVNDALNAINVLTTQRMMLDSGMTEEQMKIVQEPITAKQITVVDENSAEVNSSTLVGFLSSQGMIVPIIVFILVMFTSQMIINAVSTEKIDKTLETLLSAPVSRLSVISAKMLAAAIVALINALVYMIGFSGYIGTAMKGAIGDGSLTNALGEAMTMDDIMAQLGVNLTVGSYLLIGLQMFLTILISLSISMILGALVTDAKSAQTLLMPIMICAMVPYMISILSDVNSLSPVIRTIVYAIPFTHTFSAMSNVMFGNMQLYWIGFAYQCVFFAVCIAIALRIFTSDKIFTISLNFGQKARMKKNKHTAQQ